ncbi:2og-fe oxygenase superfamily [Fusarium beomiforme]|uniref:2og-fe oxygenase superfamily n=1 Tax=Fusarium beomiforme TaxID=44412 RepID=A0A9P5DVZ5_9HYPO|nr:2og-fe oxygenase superfamily [Fusarium beomiforme]
MPKIKNKGHKSGKVEASAPPPILPSWPAFKPSLPILDLSPEPHPLTSKVVTIPSFFPRSLCRDYVAFLKTLPLQTTPGRPKRGEAVRVNDRFQVESYDFAARLWEQTGLKEILLDGDVDSKCTKDEKLLSVKNGFCGQIFASDDERDDRPMQ